MNIYTNFNHGSFNHIQFLSKYDFIINKSATAITVKSADVLDKIRRKGSKYGKNLSVILNIFIVMIIIF